MPRHHHRRPTFPLYHTSRHKPRRWPLTLRFIKGAIHRSIFVPVLLHAIFAVAVVLYNRHRNGDFALPSSLLPNLSIVVGLVLVFRNQTSYDRFWQGQMHLSDIGTCVRNLARTFLTCDHPLDGQVSARGGEGAKEANERREDERQDTETAVRLILALLYAIKHHLRAEWGSTVPSLSSSSSSTATPPPQLAIQKAEYSDLGGLLPSGTRSFEDQGLGLPIQLSVFLEGYISRCCSRNWIHGPQAAQLSVQLNNLVSAYGNMETIRLTPIPVAYLIHTKQVLALFGCVLPFAMVRDMGWYCVGIVSLITFTLYGIEGIGEQLEDPFGYDKNDIKMDAVVEDLRVEVMVLLEQWRMGGKMFRGGV